MGLKKGTISSNTGFGVIEVLVSIAISLILTQAISSMMLTSFQQQQKLNSKLQFTSVKESILGYISNQSAWEKTVDANGDVSFLVESREPLSWLS